MKLHELNVSPTKKSTKRVGRGPGSGMGRTSTRGEKGQKSRSGSGIPAWFQGGQSPLYRRLPKRGFNNARFTKRYQALNLNDFDKFNDGDIVTPEKLKEMGIIKKELTGIKILAYGELTKKVTIQAHRFSSKSLEKIESAGGKAEVI